MKRRFSQVDVFGEDHCTGNPVAVVLDAEGLDEETMRRLTTCSSPPPKTRHLCSDIPYA